ncbi:MobA/MobL family protein [Sphingobium sp. LB126]|uniref:MobA/MobL family protein n=1 Tax=Sphingobium sp. LB126 TaxID=1983755 RepID=UPI0024137378|nr:MobA/MobL family protein [Sphingobium sp. LB126]
MSERHGVAVDVAIHAPGREGDHRNHHAHLLTTTRRIGPEGLGAKTRELDQKTSGEVERWRGRWAEMQNAALERANVPERVDHRSHQRRGIEQEATVHMGPSATAMERRAEHQAMREGRAYEPVTMVGQHNAGVIEQRGLRQYIERGPSGCAMQGSDIGQAACVRGHLERRGRSRSARCSRGAASGAACRERTREQAQGTPAGAGP